MQLKYKEGKSYSRSQPLNNLIQIRQMQSTNRQHHPRSLHNIIQLQLLDQFTLTHMRLNIDLIRQHQQRRRADTPVIEEFVQFLLGRGEFHGSRGIDDEQYDVASLAVSTPFGAVLGLTSDVPAFHLDAALLKDFDVEAYGGDRFDGLAVGQGVEEGGFAGVFEADDDHVEFFGEEYVEEFA